MPQLETQDLSVKAQKKLTNFFAHVSRASQRALLLDYDGTLAPFSEDRDRALPYPPVPALLDRIRTSTNTRLVVVTGRRAFDIDLLLGLKHIEIWGCHGLSRLRTDGTYELPNIDEEPLKRISEADEMLREEGLSDQLEFKPGATAIHWRGLEENASQIAHTVECIWSRLSSRKGLQLLRFDGGMEIRVAAGDKGDAVRTILSEMGHGAAVAYLGDDRTDEDAFAALQGYGLSILVHQAPRPTLADLWIRPPEGVLAFLNDWLTACGGNA